ncbi:hypothetical protein NQ317_013835 [Molorchus minor]|uniref:Uncharacterized protein n=1 Tax=Molorchus minor TaxID=1323400 RepID=A0ABQ9J2J0_9CUCU|nr:hypothetical protein NQ317_013835 [Molorchus minor]
MGNVYCGVEMCLKTHLPSEVEIVFILNIRSGSYQRLKCNNQQTQTKPLLGSSVNTCSLSSSQMDKSIFSNDDATDLYVDRLILLNPTQLGAALQVL